MIRDIYGFKRPLQWVKASELEAFDQTYAHILDKQANKWDKFLAEYDGKWPPVCSKCEFVSDEPCCNQIR